MTKGTKENLSNIFGVSPKYVGNIDVKELILMEEIAKQVEGLNKFKGGNNDK